MTNKHLPHAKVAIALYDIVLAKYNQEKKMLSSSVLLYFADETGGNKRVSCPRRNWWKNTVAAVRAVMWRFREEK